MMAMRWQMLVIVNLRAYVPHKNCVNLAIVNSGAIENLVSNGHNG